MPHYSLNPDLSFLDQEINLGLCTYYPWLSRLNKQTAQAKIQNSRSVVTSATAPVDPHSLGQSCCASFQ